MPSHRSLRMAEAIREVVASAVLFDVSDPRVRGVTVLKVELSGDLRNATVSVSVMGTPSEQKLAMAGLKSATGFLQSRVAARLQTKFTPALAFRLDDSVKKSVEIARLIDQTLTSNHPDPNAPVGREGDESHDQDHDEDDDDDLDDDDDDSPDDHDRHP